MAKVEVTAYFNPHLKDFIDSMAKRLGVSSSRLIEESVKTCWETEECVAKVMSRLGIPIPKY